MDENQEQEPSGPPQAGDGFPRARWRVELRGKVQGVGFRPYVYRLAHIYALGGWVRNAPHGVTLEVEGFEPNIHAFLRELPRSLPPSASISTFAPQQQPARGEKQFVIQDSTTATPSEERPSAWMLTDLAPCPECLADIADPSNRRAGYPFTNCTHCGPRFSIIESLPYDRERTTMRHFLQCELCREEYEDPANRRFHAQPNACSQCGPRLDWCDRTGGRLKVGHEALQCAADALAAGDIVALKGVGGFQLLVDAGNSAAVELLRRRKGRPTKPFAVMVGSLSAAREICEISPAEAELLNSAAAPIVLLHRRSSAPDGFGESFRHVVDAVAPNQLRLGMMIPSSPLHALLFANVHFPLVATSGNLHSEPICIDGDEAIQRLNGIADFFLTHDRPVARPVDDSVAVVWGGIRRVWRRARGYAPLPFEIPGNGESILAVGGDQNNTLAILVGDQVILSQHLGDLGSELSLLAWRKVLADFLRIYAIQPDVIVHDAHPGYHSTRLAHVLADEFPAARTMAVQHHHAHLASCLAEHALPPDHEVLGVIWDGTGFGSDGTIWGGEFLKGSLRGYRRVAAWRGFLLPGGERAIHQPARVALSLLWQVLRGEVWRTPVGETFPFSQREALERMLTTGQYSVETSSAGRLFDGVAALLHPGCEVHYSGEAAMGVESLAARDWPPGSPQRTPPNSLAPGSERSSSQSPGHGWFEANCQADRYDVPLEADSHGLLRLDWRPLILGALRDLDDGDPPARIAARFHNTLALSILQVARHIALPHVLLSGGCFQNRRLTETTLGLLTAAGFEVLMHDEVPPNDGGLSLGQVAVARHRPQSGPPWATG